LKEVSIMRKVIIAILVLALVISFIAVTGCGDEESQTPEKSEGMETREQGEDERASGEEEIGPSEYVDVTPAEAQQLIAENPDIIIIDVSPNYAEGHLPGAISYYLGDGSLDRAIPSLDKDATYLVYCHVDSVAIAGAQKLIEAGFRNVYRLQGNYSAWVDAGYAVER
jgi:rhodanese-related sulfurtransferase